MSYKEIEIGEIEKVPYEIKQIEWRIPDFLSAIEDLSSTMNYVSSNFSIGNGMYQLRLWDNEDCVTMDLGKINETKYPVECYFGIRLVDSTEQLMCDILVDSCTENYNILKSELQMRKSSLLPNGVLTIVCTMKFMGNPVQQTTSTETKSLLWKDLDTLSANFKELLDNKESCDVTLKVKEKEYKAHRSVLIARSKVFAANFKHDTLEKKTGVITISDCDPDSFQKFLVYVYSGELENLSSSSALSLYYTADKYDVEGIKVFCVEYLIQCLSVENVCEIAMLADKYDEAQLIFHVQNFFNKNASKIFETSEWIQLWKEDYRLANKLLIEMSKVRLKD